VPFAEHRGCRLYYEVDGDASSGPALVMIRGFARSMRYWGRIRGLMAEQMPILVMDNRGVGRSDAPAPPYSTATLADDVAAVMDHAGIESAHVFGLSLGGMIAQQVALRHPSRVERLVLGCTHHGGLGTLPPGRTIVATLRAGFMAPDQSMRHMAPYLLGPDKARSPELLELWTQASLADPRSMRGLIGQLTAVFRHRTRHRLAAIRNPTLVISGDQDWMIPLRHSRVVAAKIPGAELHVIPGAGHDFPTDHPEETADAIARFLRSG
jgi:pimeloyl-ACP methyl ester carboxylesterase